MLFFRFGLDDSLFIRSIGRIPPDCSAIVLFFETQSSFYILLSVYTCIVIGCDVTKLIVVVLSVGRIPPQRVFCQSCFFEIQSSPYILLSACTCIVIMTLQE